MVRELQRHEYIPLEVHNDTTLIHRPAFASSTRLRTWADRHYTRQCYRCETRVQPSSVEEIGEGYNQWVGDKDWVWHPKWCFIRCCQPLSNDQLQNGEF